MRYKLLLLFLLAMGITFYWLKINDEKNTNNIPIEEVKELVFDISGLEFKQGGYIVISIKNIGKSNLRLDNDIAPNINEIYINNDIGYCYIPISISKISGDYNITIYKDDDIVKAYNIKILPEEFISQHLIINESVLKETTSTKAIDEYNQAVTKARSYNLKQRMFEEEFIIPVDGRISTEFGIKRYINNNPNPTRHYGIDIAAPKGTIVKATASGIVVFSDYITSAGNYIIIDHGMGLLSHYAHMDSREVNELVTVKQGDTIGYVGSTGMSTGNHLHFDLTIKNIHINPWLFIKR